MKYGMYLVVAGLVERLAKTMECKGTSDLLEAKRPGCR